MPLRPTPGPCTLLLFAALTLLIPLHPRAALAQSSPDLQPAAQARPTPPSVDQEQVIAYWTTETGWHSELQLRNNQVGHDLTVTPALRLADGAETPLAPVTIKPQEVKAIDLDAAIGTYGPQFIGTYGSLVLRYRSPGVRSLYAALMVHNIGHPFAFHIDATAEWQDLQTGSREGIWWLPKDTTSDYLILTNQGANTLPVDLSLYDANGKESKQKVLLGPRESTRYSIRKLIQAAGLTGSYGGIKVSAGTHAGSLDSFHFLFDETAGFSAVLKMFDRNPNTKLEERDYAGTNIWTLRAPMLALRNPDPALAFPPGTLLRPQLFIRNTIGKPVDASIRFNWRAGNTTGKAAGPALHLSPYETRRIDIAVLQNANTLPKEANWTSVTLTTNGLPDEVMAVATSYDETLKYGAQTPFSDQLSFQWEGGMWEYDPYHSSIFTAGNGGTKPTQAAFTIFYNQGVEKYELEQTLQPDEQMWIDIGKLIREHVPDKNGKTLPEDLTSGSYEIRDLTSSGLGTLFEGKITYDKTYGHAAYGCANCCDFQRPTLNSSALGIPFQGTSQNGVTAYQLCADIYTDVSSYFLNGWKSGNTGITTVNYDGTYTGVAVGSTSFSTSGPIPTGQQLKCPAYIVTLSGTATVVPPTLSCSPSSVTRGSSTTCSISNVGSGATISSWKFTDSNNNTVSRSGNNNLRSWSGAIVTGGTVRVSAGSIPLSAKITVTNRSGFTFSAATPTPEPNGFSTTVCGTISVPSPPQAGKELGFYCVQQAYSFNSQSINDAGPNQGYKYITSLSNSNGGTNTAYYYVVSPDAADPNSTFSKAQCGNYSSSTNPNGYINQPNLISNIIRHESGNMNSHYSQYVVAQNNSANNLGTVGEQIVGLPSDTNFSGTVAGILNPKLSLISSSALTPEPCSANYNGSVTPCVFQGYVNYIPYAACN